MNDHNVFYQDIWFAGKSKPKTVPNILKMEVQKPLPGLLEMTVTAWYWWKERSHRVTITCTEDDDWKDVLATALTSHFWTHYPDDADKAFDF